ncbi:MAG: long-chain fatty acid--CoA ligase, partial [bacterium]
DDGEITRTRKLRRRVIAERYAPLIDALYSDAESVNVEIPVTYEDGRTSVLKAEVRLWHVGAPPAAPAGALDRSA